MRSFLTLRNTTILMFLAAVLLVPGAARAEQIVLFDISYTHTNANDSHHTVSGAALKQPANWTAPINYAQGTIHFYHEVETKPSNKDTIIDFCLISTRGYGCIETIVYKTTGLHETMRSMAGGDVNNRNLIAFTQPMRSIQLVLKTPVTYINGGRPQSDFLPSKMRFVATLVSPGGTYVKPTPTPGFNPGPSNAGDGGATPTTDAGAVSDVAPAVDATVVTDAGVAIDAPVTSTPPPPPDAATAPPTGTPSQPDAAPRPPGTPPAAPPSTPSPSSSSSGCSFVADTSATGGGLGVLAALAGLALALPSARRRRR